jgi:molybdenum cofactor cytidylyltransferase
MALSPSFCGVILAAGASTRMGRDKALLPWRDTTFVESAMRAMEPVTDLVIVVCGANSELLSSVVSAAGAYLAINPHPERGQFSSLRVGVQEVLSRGRDAALITLVDRPAPRLETVRKLKQEFLDAPPDIWAVVPQFEDRHGHPFAAGREMIEAFLRAPADSTAREVEHEHQRHIRYVDVDDPLVVWNVDTPEDYQRILNG